MMQKILNKEFKLCMNTATAFFLLFGLMVFIPGYPYYVSFLYFCLGVFFISLYGRENHDIEYMLTLPIKKSDVVRGRYLFIGVLELIMWLITAGFVMIRLFAADYPNAAGIDANVAFLGLSLVMLAGFNAIYFGGYYKNVEKPGKPLVGGFIWIGLFILAAEVPCFIEPTKSYLDTMELSAQIKQLPVLAAGIIIYCVVMAVSCKSSIKRFEKQDF